MRPSQAKILIIDDDELLAEYLKTLLTGYGYRDIRLCYDGKNAEAYFEEGCDLVLLDLLLPGIPGQEILDTLHKSRPEIPIVVVTAVDTVDTAVECMKAGAFDFLTKPIQENRLVPIVQHALMIRELQRKVDMLETGASDWQLKNPEAFQEILTESEIMHNLFVNIEAVSASPKAVLITGESGTGKELVARAVHRLSKRSGSFVAVNVSGLDETMFTDTLFGHTKGSFTGAEGERRGLVEKAAEGTLFLDEIGDLEAGAQVKLLRILQEGEYYPIGSDRPSQSRTRIVAATNADLYTRQKTGAFRADLYYRLITHHLEIPPLRDRTGDLPLLINHFINDAAAGMGRPVPSVPKELLTLLSSYAFPGNIRELQAMLYDAVGRSETKDLNLAAVRDFINKHEGKQETLPKGTPGFYPPYRGIEDFPSFKEVEDMCMREALRLSGGNQSRAAHLLGVSQSTLSRWVKSNKKT